MAKVKTTNADTYLQSFAPVFLDYANKFIYAYYNQFDKNWTYVINGKVSGMIKGSRHGLLCHWEILKALGDEKHKDWDEWTVYFISGRLNPDGSVIYIHDLNSRLHNPSLARRYEKRVDKVVDKVYKYMADFLD